MEITKTVTCTKQDISRFMIRNYFGTMRHIFIFFIFLFPLAYVEGLIFGFTEFHTILYVVFGGLGLFGTLMMLASMFVGGRVQYKQRRLYHQTYDITIRDEGYTVKLQNGMEQSIVWDNVFMVRMAKKYFSVQDMNVDLVVIPMELFTEEEVDLIHNTLSQNDELKRKYSRIEIV